MIDHLDVLKKETAGAREAIRWLETEFHKGNRFVVVQLFRQCPTIDSTVGKDSHENVLYLRKL